MHVFHFADTHLGFAESSRVAPDSGVNLREQDAYDAFNAVIEEAAKRRPDLVVHVGDLFHSPRPSHRAIVTAMAGFKRLSEAGICVVLTAGNHSVPRMSTTTSIFAALVSPMRPRTRRSATRSRRSGAARTSPTTCSSPMARSRAW